MQVISAIDELRRTVQTWRKADQSVGFVPTMGNLHAGHLALLKEAARHCQRVVASIFVNPLQFDEEDDLLAYPRTLEADMAQLESIGVDTLFTPTEASLYPHGREAITRVDVVGLGDILEGAARPGHFVGVSTVVTKLFNCVQPDLAVFGEKDFQQWLLVRRLVADLNMPITLVGLATVREADGLAMSSRNRRLTADERKIAPLLYQELQTIRQTLLRENSDYVALEQVAIERLRQLGFVPEYVAIRDADTLACINNDTENRVILAAARLGDTRLIDNLRL
ncbi:Pantoate--beta-alanine ligase [hydrothermal vent metagenome]|uniref:pantoate--beta-alanine ligase (AMP-forming) n=1 Tax=hydrothermal vent metagenome TaxID=652676 RepID=A0A3B1CA13_9ZZZZ